MINESSAEDMNAGGHPEAAAGGPAGARAQGAVRCAGEARVTGLPRVCRAVAWGRTKPTKDARAAAAASQRVQAAVKAAAQ